MHRGLKATNVFSFFVIKFIFINFTKWNFTDSDEILGTLILTRCLNLEHISWRLIEWGQSPWNLGESNKKYIKFEVKKISLESFKFYQEINDDVQLDLKNNTLTAFKPPSAERVNAKSQYLLHRKWPIACISCTHQKIIQIWWGLHDNFCVWKKSAITFGEGCTLMLDIHVYSAFMAWNLGYLAKKVHDIPPTLIKIDLIWLTWFLCIRYIHTNVC